MYELLNSLWFGMSSKWYSSISWMFCQCQFYLSKWFCLQWYNRVMNCVVVANTSKYVNVIVRWMNLCTWNIHTSEVCIKIFVAHFDKDKKQYFILNNLIPTITTITQSESVCCFLLVFSALARNTAPGLGKGLCWKRDPDAVVSTPVLAPSGNRPLLHDPLHEK